MIAILKGAIESELESYSAIENAPVQRRPGVDGPTSIHAAAGTHGPAIGGRTVFVTAGILTLTAGLFFMLPRTADAAFRRFISSRIFLPGFSNEVTLGQIGQIKSSSRPVMHVMHSAIYRLRSTEHDE